MGLFGDQRSCDPLCEICISLNYTKSDQIKLQQNVATPFILSAVPTDLLKAILVKMDAKSFTRIRRANKEYSEYIENNRGNLKIAMFHTMNIVCGFDRQKGPIVIIDYIGRYNAHPFDHQLAKYKMVGDSQNAIMVFNEFGQFKNAVALQIGRSVMNFKNGTRTIQCTLRPRSLALYLREWQNMSEFRKELTGVYLDQHIQHDFLLGHYSNEDCQILANFINWARFTRISFYAAQPVNYAPLKSLIRLNAVKLDRISNVNTDFLQLEEFKNIKHIYFYNCDQFHAIPDHLKRIETLNLHGIPICQSGVLGLLLSWISGYVMLKEFCIATKWNISLKDHHIKHIQKSKKWKFCCRSMSFDEWKTEKNLKVYQLQQENTGKKAKFIVTDLFARFRVITSSD